MQGADTGIQQELDGLGLHIGIVQSRFNEDHQCLGSGLHSRIGRTWCS